MIAERRLQVQNSPRQYQQQAPQALPQPFYDPGYDLYRTRSANSLENLSRPLDPPLSSAIDPSLTDILRRPPVGAKTPLPPASIALSNNPRVQFNDNVRYNEYTPNPRSVPNVPVQQLHTTPTTFGTSRQPVVDNGFNFTEEQNKDLKSLKAKEYQEELQRQVREKQMQKQREKEEKEKMDKKMLMETMTYNPFGRSGGGAPIKDKEGNVVADLSQVKSDSARFSPRDIVPPQNQFAFPAPNNPKGSNEMLNLLFKSPQSPTTQQSFFGGGFNTASNNNNNGDQSFARGGNGIFGEGKSDEKKKQEEKYKAELQQQVFVMPF